MNLSMEVAAEKFRQLAAAAQAAIEGKGSKYFATNNKKGEIFELKNELNADRKERRKDAVKTVIANMTIGKDVSSLFADVLKCMQTDDLELKKLVYLYLMNYAKSQPELVILAVNTFCKDTEDVNPLIRALAIRTMGCLRVDKIIDYLCEPLRKALVDQHPYVRKTAAICVAKLFELAPSLAEENGFITTLQEMLSDGNPMVVSNAVAALIEIHSSDPSRNAFSVNSTTLTKLLNALNECTEWGQVTILDALANYTPANPKEAELIVERVLPRLQHANAAVVLASVKVLLLYISSFIKNDEIVKQTQRKISPPLVSLMSSIPEVQYVALRNLRVVLQHQKSILGDELRVFFCNYNDPPYIKLEKLDIIVKLCSEGTLEQILQELKEYTNEVDIEFVRASIRTMGRCAIKVPNSAEKTLTALLELVHTKVSHVVQEAVIVAKDILRQYPHGFEGVIPMFCEQMDILDEPEAKASMIWMIGEYAEKIENALDLLTFFSDSFAEETRLVQLQLLTATVKLFLKKPAPPSQGLVQKLLGTVTDHLDDADLRDRAYIYWRLLSADPQTARRVVLAEKPPVSDESQTLDDSLLDEMLHALGSLASVYHLPAKAFSVQKSAPILSMRDVQHQLKEATLMNPDDVDGNNVIAGQHIIENLLDLDLHSTSQLPHSVAQSNPILDLLGDDFLGLADVAQQQPQQNVSRPASPPRKISGNDMLFIYPKQVILNAQQGQGMEISATFSSDAGQVMLDLTISNQSNQPMGDFGIQLNKNSFGLIPTALLNCPNLGPGSSFDTSVPLGTTGPIQKTEPINILQLAIKNNVQVFYMSALVPLNVVSLPSVTLDASGFAMAWSHTTANTKVPPLTLGQSDNLVEKLSNNRFHVIHQDQQKLQVAVQFTNQFTLLAQVELTGAGVTVTARSQVAEFIPAFYQVVEAIIHQ